MIAIVSVAAAGAAAVLFLIGVRLHPRRPRLAQALLLAAVVVALASIPLALTGAGRELAP